MMMNVYVTYDVEQVTYGGGQGFYDEVCVLNTFENYGEAYAYALEWKKEHSNSVWTNIRIHTNYHLPPNRITEI